MHWQWYTRQAEFCHEMGTLTSVYLGNLPQIVVKIKNIWNHHPKTMEKPSPWTPWTDPSTGWSTGRQVASNWFDRVRQHNQRDERGLLRSSLNDHPTETGKSDKQLHACWCPSIGTWACWTHHVSLKEFKLPSGPASSKHSTASRKISRGWWSIKRDWGTLKHVGRNWGGKLVWWAENTSRCQTSVVTISHFGVSSHDHLVVLMMAMMMMMTTTTLLLLLLVVVVERNVLLVGFATNAFAETCFKSKASLF